MSTTKMTTTKMTTNIQCVDSCPVYIKFFINNNYKDIKQIYDKHSEEENNDGILVFQCSEKENTMNMQYANDSYMKNILAEESVCNLKSSIPPGKILLFIQDLDLNSIFLIHI
tara:strand:+ start:542 stop:880 length:339 start_codon:yes stop_codon:yes gene_type:complete